MRLNTKPIFINGFSRGGTNILQNLLQSHPNVCVPTGEMNQVFRGNQKPLIERGRLVLEYLPILCRENRDILSARNWSHRKKIKTKTAESIDQRLYKDKTIALKPGQNLFKSEGCKYTLSEIEDSRLLCKALDGLILFSKQLNEIFPDSTFVAIVRNGYALCESHLRRGAKLERIAEQYEKGCREIIKNSESMENFYVIRFEDILNNSFDSLNKLYQWAQLDLGAIDNIRLQKKKVIKHDGSYNKNIQKSTRETIWYQKKDFAKHFEKRVNSYQIKNLTLKQICTINEVCHFSMSYFGYLNDDK